MNVHKSAATTALRRKSRERPRESEARAVQTTRVDPLVWQFDLRLAGGDARREGHRSVIVLNAPERRERR